MHSRRLGEELCYGGVHTDSFLLHTTLHATVGQKRKTCHQQKRQQTPIRDGIFHATNINNKEKPRLSAQRYMAVVLIPMH